MDELSTLGARLLYALAIAGGGVLLWLSLRRFLLSRASRAAVPLPGFRPGVPAVLYFTTPDCSACKSLQRPALAELDRRMTGSLQLIEVDAYERPDLARRWSVLSIPTTFVLDGQGRPVHVNQGVASADRLFGQLNRLA